MTDANRTRVVIAEESVFGQFPSSPPFETIRVTSTSLSFAPQTTVSEELRSDRQTADLILVGAEASGDMGFELSFSSHDRLLEGALFEDWNESPSIVHATTEITDVGDTAAAAITVPSGGDDFSAGSILTLSGFTNAANNGKFYVTTATSTTITCDSPGFTAETSIPVGARVKASGFQGDDSDVAASTTGSNKLTSSTTDFTDWEYNASTRPWGLRAGMWVKLRGFVTTTENNDFCRIQSVSATELVFDIVPSGFTAESAPANVEVLWTDHIRNGVTEKSYSIQQAYLANGQFLYMRGMEVSSMSFSMESQSIMTGTVNLMGKDGQYVADSFTGDMSFSDGDVAVTSGELSGATYAAASATDVLNTSSNVGRIAENGTPVSGPNFIASAQFTVENNLRLKNAIGNLGAIGIGAGTCNISGSLNTYFGDTTLLTKVLQNTATSLDFRVGRSDGGTMVFDFPRVKLSSGTTPVTGINTDVMSDIGFQAIRHPTLGYQAHIQKFEEI